MSRTTLYNILLVMLTMTSGCVDAISFLELGQVFTAAMTGNTVLFGLAAVHTGGLSIPGYAMALLGFIIGVAVGAVVLIRSQKTTGWGRAVTVSICIELAALVLVAVIVSISSPIVHAGSEADLLIVILAFAMGIQGVAARRIGVAGVTTTVITSTLTGLVESLVWKVGDRVRSSNVSREDSAPETKKAASGTSLLSVSMWVIVIVFYGIGAAMCGALESHWHLCAVWLPVAIVLVVVVAAATSGIRVKVEHEAGITM